MGRLRDVRPGDRFVLHGRRYEAIELLRHRTDGGPTASAIGVVRCKRLDEPGEVQLYRTKQPVHPDPLERADPRKNERICGDRDPW